jgi:hypothetical protein
MSKTKKKLRVSGLTIWFTEAERKEIERRRGSLPASTWVREQLLSLMAMP